MHPNQVAKSYDQIAHIWRGAAFDRTNGIDQHKRALNFTSGQGGIALDVGCGSNERFQSLLRSRGFEYEGVNFSTEMLRLARAAAPQLTFHHADICEWVLPRFYDFISAWDSIWHVPLDKQPAVLTKLCGGLNSAGVLIFTAGGLELPDEQENSHMGVPMYHATLGVPRILSLLHEGGCVLRHFEYDQYPQPHVYFIAQRV